MAETESGPRRRWRGRERAPGAGAGMLRVANRCARVALVLALLLLMLLWVLFLLRVMGAVAGARGLVPRWFVWVLAVPGGLALAVALVAVLLHLSGRILDVMADPGRLLRVRMDELIFLIACGTLVVGFLLARLQELGEGDSWMTRRAWIWAPLVFLGLLIAGRWGRDQDRVTPVRSSRERLILMLASWLRVVGFVGAALFIHDLFLLHNAQFLETLDDAMIRRAAIDLSLSFLILPSHLIHRRLRARITRTSPILKRLEEGNLRS